EVSVSGTRPQPGAEGTEVAAPPQLAPDAAGRWLSSGSGHACGRLGSAVCFCAGGRVLHGEDAQDARLYVPRGRHEISLRNRSDSAGYSASSTVTDFITGRAAQRIVYVSRGRRATWAWRLGRPASSQA